MGALADRIAAVPPGDPEPRIAALRAAELPPASRAWLLWLEAEWAWRAGAFSLAEVALDEAEAAAAGWSPPFAIEVRLLRAKLWQDGGEPGRAYEPLMWAKDGWLFAAHAMTAAAGEPATAGPRPQGRASPTADPAADFAAPATRGAMEMVAALLRRMPPDVAVALWLRDRVVPAISETVARAIALEARLDSFSGARRLANDVLAQARGWRLPGWDVRRFEAGLRLALASAASGESNFTAAIGQADDGLALTARLPAGDDTRRVRAELRSNRAGALLALDRCAEAAEEFAAAREEFTALGATVPALRMRLSALRAADGAGEAVAADALRALVGELGATAASLARPDGGLMADLELARRWLLSLLAAPGGGAPPGAARPGGAPADDAVVEEAVGLIEALRDDRPPLRDAADRPDPVLARVCRPLTLLAARLGRLPATALLVLEPGLRGGRERPPVLLALGSAGEGAPLRRHLGPAGAAAEALRALGALATRERERLLTGELPFRSPASPELVHAARAAWEALPESVREIVAEARTLLLMPSGLGGLDALPFELLRHPAGHLGATHAVARVPSFQYLEAMLAPGARCPPANPRAVVALTTQDEQLGVLAAAEGEADLASRAAQLLGLQPERVELREPADALAAFAGPALVHYVGHGVANAIGEVLPLSAGRGVSASQLPDPGGAAAPFAFFSACLLGRVRHLPGGRQRGWALRLLEHGAPAVVGALAAIPDQACVPVAEAFYGAAWREPVGEAMRLARARLDAAGVHPLVWAAYALHGDPHARIGAGGGSAALVRRWPAHATRHLATGDPADLAAVREARPELAAEPDLAALAAQLLDSDPEGAAVCRLLLALERGERDLAHLLASALNDGYAVLRTLDGAWEGREAARDAAVRWWRAALAGDAAL